MGDCLIKKSVDFWLVYWKGESFVRIWLFYQQSSSSSTDLHVWPEDRWYATATDHHQKDWKTFIHSPVKGSKLFQTWDGDTANSVLCASFTPPKFPTTNRFQVFWPFYLGNKYWYIMGFGGIFRHTQMMLNDGFHDVWWLETKRVNHQSSAQRWIFPTNAAYRRPDVECGELRQHSLWHQWTRYSFSDRSVTSITSLEHVFVFSFSRSLTEKHGYNISKGSVVGDHETWWDVR